jgi:hypothetical protein
VQLRAQLYQGLTIDTNGLPSIANNYDTTNGRVLWPTDAANNLTEGMKRPPVRLALVPK